MPPITPTAPSIIPSPIGIAPPAGAGAIAPARWWCLVVEDRAAVRVDRDHGATRGRFERDERGVHRGRPAADHRGLPGHFQPQVVPGVPRVVDVAEAPAVLPVV